MHTKKIFANSLLKSHKGSISILVRIVISAHFNLSILFVVSHFLSAKLLPEWRLNPGSGTQKECPFLLDGGVS